MQETSKSAFFHTRKGQANRQALVTLKSEWDTFKVSQGTLPTSLAMLRVEQFKARLAIILGKRR